ncbi:TIP41-like family-domain-containing protein [Baffinella frigidus]|nr:TIP41-like family-domain-containing protein [Cryptophyta sp. CCMP2293]
MRRCKDTLHVRGPETAWPSIFPLAASKVVCSGGSSSLRHSVVFAMARVVEGDARTGTWARPATPQMGTDADGQFVSRGWNELEHKGWVFKARTRPPSGGAAAADLRDALSLGPVPLPQKVYAENLLECSHESGVKIEFTAEAALGGWQSAQQKEFGGSLSAENFDRHFNTPYAGSIVVDKDKLREKLRMARKIEAPDFGVPGASREKLPMDLLQQRGHIHFYDQVELFGEAFADGGQVLCETKARVMDDCFLVLLRYFIVKPNSGVHMRDVRYFHKFGTGNVLRDHEVREASIPELEDAVSKLRPVTASMDEKATHDHRYFTNPEQVWEALTPTRTLNESFSLSV